MVFFFCTKFWAEMPNENEIIRSDFRFFWRDFRFFFWRDFRFFGAIFAFSDAIFAFLKKSENRAKKNENHAKKNPDMPNENEKKKTIAYHWVHFRKLMMMIMNSTNRQ